MLFIDDGGVLNDNARRAPQWQRLVGEFFAPRLGGTSQIWAEANRLEAPRIIDAFWGEAASPYPTFAEHHAAYHLAWLGSMCERVGVPMLPRADALELAQAATDYVVTRVRADIPGATEAVTALHRAGFALHTASGGSSRDLHHCLTSMGVRDCFGTLFGADLVDFPKAGPDYYRRVFARVGVDPARALVIDDQARVGAWAREAGARVLLVGPDGDCPDLRAAARQLLGPGSSL